MKALFLAGGMGTRLRPLTNSLPKPMVPVMSKPLLERNLLNLKRYGVNDIVISTCYKPYYIERYFGDGSEHGLNIKYVAEDIPLGTGGAIKNAHRYFNDTFIIFNSDILSDINLNNMIAFHKEKQADVTIAATYVENPSMYGVIEYDDKDYALTFKEKPSPGEITSNYINAGIYVFEPHVLDEIPADRVVSVEKETFPKLLEKGYKIAVFKSECYWMDIGTHEKYIQAHKDIFDARCSISEKEFNASEGFISSSCKIHPSATVERPVYIADNVEIGPFAYIGPGTVIGRNCRIGTASRVVGSILWDDVHVESGCVLINSVISHKCLINRYEEYYNTIYAGDISKTLAVKSS